MAQLYYRYSTMNAGKSLEILKIANNYREQGKSVLIFTSVIDDRFGVGKVTSRIGISEDAVLLHSDTSPFETTIKELKKRKLENKKINCILVDESQFLNEKQIYDFTLIVDKLNIPVICYGLKNDYRNRLFEGSEWLLVYADKIEEVKTVCWCCDKKATMILKFVDGRPVYNGNQIEIGGNDTYKSVCRNHYYNWESEKKIELY